MNKKIILGIAAHPDDLEFSCGGSLAKWKEEDCQIYYAAFSPCKKSIPEGFDSNILYRELQNSCTALGIKEEQVFTYNIPVRDFPEHRQAILETLIDLRKKLNPDLVLIPNSSDVHQDHHQIHLEGVRAFRKISMLGYELIWNNSGAMLNYHVPLALRHLDKKVEMINNYETQKGRPYANVDFIKSWARMRGILCNSKFAESFELINWKDD